MSEFTNKILVVDDNEPVLMLISKLLKDPARKILTANSGQSAIDIIEKESDISLILMDIQMPGMDGFETVKKIKENERFKDIPVIFITGFYKSRQLRALRTVFLIAIVISGLLTKFLPCPTLDLLPYDHLMSDPQFNYDVFDCGFGYRCPFCDFLNRLLWGPTALADWED